MRGYFGIGVEGVSKPMNVGNLFRSAHGFGASFVFTIDAHHKVAQAKSDTSRGIEQLPWYDWADIDEFKLPLQCTLVGVELTDDAIELPSFRHPSSAAYVLGQERGSLSDELMARCEFIVKIPTSFCINVATAGAIIMYDRTISLRNFAERPVKPGGSLEIEPVHQWGLPRKRTKE